MESLRPGIKRIKREQPAEAMAEQRLAIGIDPKALADFGAQFAGQKVQELVASARSTGSSQAGPRRRVVHHDEILVALFGIGHVGLVSDADAARLAAALIFLNPLRFGKCREAGIPVESTKRNERPLC